MGQKGSQISYAREEMDAEEKKQEMKVHKVNDPVPKLANHGRLYSLGMRPLSG
jgi:hypothetical protein